MHRPGVVVAAGALNGALLVSIDNLKTMWLYDDALLGYHPADLGPLFGRPLFAPAGTRAISRQLADLAALYRYLPDR